METQEFVPQYLDLMPGEDGKVWVAEIAGDDAIYKLKRVFLPQIKEGVYEIFDGAYQIHGIHPGITPFNKEYCLVNHGHMERRVPFGSMIEILPYLKQYEPVRCQRIKFQITEQLQSIRNLLNHDLVTEDIHYMIDQLDDLEGSQELTQTLTQLIKRKPQMIEDYRYRLGISDKSESH